MSRSPVILLAGGGTGGHALPGVAVARALRDAVPGVRFLRAVTPRDDAAAWAGVLEGDPVPVASPRLPRGAGEAPAFGFGMTRSLLRSLRVLRRERVDAVLALGGYGCVGPGLAALWRGIPVVTLEANAVPGAAVRLLHRWGALTAISFEVTRGHLQEPHRAYLTGNPLRTDVERPRKDYAAFGLDPLLPVIAVVGGSLGARGLNERVAAALPLFRGQGVQLLWVSGREGAVEATDALVSAGVPGRVLPWCSDMAALYGTATVLLSRSGGGAVAEAAVAGVPSVFVPYPHHADRQQWHNAEPLARCGAASILDEVELSPERLAGEVLAVARDPERRARMAAAARAAGRPGAAEAVARLVLDRLAPDKEPEREATGPRRSSRRVLQA